MRATDADAVLPILLHARDADGARAQAVRQGSVGGIHFLDRAAQAAFVDLAAIAPRPRPPSLDAGGARWDLAFAVAPEHVAVVAAGRATSLDRSVGEQLELAAAGGRGRQEAVPRARRETGLLRDVPDAARVARLSWLARVELEFLQAWIQEPEWLLFDSVFDHPDAEDALHLPSLFQRRFPLRAISFLGARVPRLAGAATASPLHF